MYFFYPETSNLSLEEIDYLFLEKNAVKASLDPSARESAKAAAMDASVPQMNDDEKTLNEHAENL